MSEDASDQLVEPNMGMNDGLLAVNVKRTAETTTGTFIEAFAEFFAHMYERF